MSNRFWLALFKMNALAGVCLMAACQRGPEPPVAAGPPPLDSPVVVAGPGSIIETQDGTVIVAPTPAPTPLAPTTPPGTIELGGFKPVQESPGNITRMTADNIEQDASGKYILRGRAVVEVRQGAGQSRLMGEYISEQGGPGFAPEVIRRGAK